MGWPSPCRFVQIWFWYTDSLIPLCSYFRIMSILTECGILLIKRALFTEDVLVLTVLPHLLTSDYTPKNKFCQDQTQNRLVRSACRCKRIYTANKTGFLLRVSMNGIANIKFGNKKGERRNDVIVSSSPGARLLRWLSCSCSLNHRERTWFPVSSSIVATLLCIFTAGFLFSEQNVSIRMTYWLWGSCHSILTTF